MCWGDNSYGKCNIPSPNSGFIAIAAGEVHSLAIKKVGQYKLTGDLNDDCRVGWEDVRIFTWQWLDSDSGEQFPVAAAQEANSPGVLPNDEYFPLQWHLLNTGQSGGTPGADIRAPEAWDVTTGDPNIVIAVIDVGVDTHHPDLVNNLVPGYDFWDNDDMPDPAMDDPMDTHGTTCAGLIAAEGNNGIGVTGVAYNCKIMPIRHGTTGGLITQEEEVTAFRWAAANGADVISCSWHDIDYTPIIHSAVKDVTKLGGIGREGKGCIVFFVAGNEGSRIVPTSSPAYPEVIAVGATDHNDVRYDYSNYGPELDIVAPSGCFSNLAKCPECDSLKCQADVPFWTTDFSGSLGHSTRNDDPNIVDYVQWECGTSMSCPVAAGVAALILSLEPNLTSDEVRHFLERSAKDLGAPGRDDYYGWGRVDARAALDMVLAKRKRADLNNDGKVDLKDFSRLAQYWQQDESSVDIGPNLWGDGIVDVKDLAVLADYWLRDFRLAAYWKLDETEGSIAHDSSGNNHNGTLTGSPQWVVGHIGGALQFNGTTDYVSTPNINLTSNTVTITAWVRRSGDQTGWAGIVFQRTTAACGMGFSGNATNQLQYNWNDAPATYNFVSGLTVPNNEWAFVALVIEPSRGTLYLNDTSSINAVANPAVTLGVINIGQDPYGGRLVNGTIDDVRIYTVVLSAAQIQQLRNGMDPTWPAAEDPLPADGAVTDTNALFLTWTPGDTAVSHEGFFSSNWADINERKPSASLGPTSDRFYYVEGLARGIPYYWCVDEKDAGNNVYKGNIWSFTVMPFKTWSPSPTNGQALVSTAPTLYWNQGAGAIASVVYFGTSSTSLTYKKVINHTLGQLRYNWPVTPTPLAYNTTYYWRIDQREPNSAILKGDVWSFTTVPNIAITDPTLLGWWKLDEGSGTTVLDWSGHNRHGTINGGATYATGVFDKALNLDGIDDWVSVGNRILYVDGVEVARDTQDAVAPSGGGLHIGAGKNLETGTFWSDLIDDVRIYDRAVAP